MKNLIHYHPHAPANTGHMGHHAAPEWEVQAIHFFSPWALAEMQSEGKLFQCWYAYSKKITALDTKQKPGTAGTF